MTDNIEFDPAKIAALPVFDVVDYLDSDEMIAEYLVAVLEDSETDPAKELETLRRAVQDVIGALRKRCS
jgi:DNA-binding phage protein